MVVSSFSSLQSASVPFRGCLWFPAGGCSRERSRKWNCLLAVASAKKPETGLPIESEVLEILYFLTFYWTNGVILGLNYD